MNIKDLDVTNRSTNNVFRYVNIDKKGDDMVDILLSTYNGEKYLKELLDSLLKQSYKNINIIIRDDGSSDGTINIINKYIVDNKNIHLYKDNLGNVGHAKSFLILLEQSKSEYIAFCDQDDVWDKRKVEKSLKAISSMNDPVLVFCDLKIVDKNLNEIAESYYKHYERDAYKMNFNYMVSNQVSIHGCSMIFNKQVKDIVFYSNIQNIADHDLYISFVVASFGHIVFVDYPLIEYRQTGNNYSHNSISKKRNSLLIRIRNVINNDLNINIKIIKKQIKYYETYAEFKASYSSKLDKDSIRLINRILYKKRKYEFLLKLLNIIN